MMFTTTKHLKFNRRLWSKTDGYLVSVTVMVRNGHTCGYYSHCHQQTRLPCGCCSHGQKQTHLPCGCYSHGQKQTHLWLLQSWSETDTLALWLLQSWSETDTLVVVTVMVRNRNACLVVVTVMVRNRHTCLVVVTVMVRNGHTWVCYSHGKKQQQPDSKQNSCHLLSCCLWYSSSIPLRIASSQFSSLSLLSL